MTRKEHLLTKLAEECSEVAQRASKALRFGLQEVQPGQLFNNAERLMHEVEDVQAVLEMLGLEDPGLVWLDEERVAAKKAKVERFLEYSRECGTLTEDR